MPERDVSASEVAEYSYCSVSWYMDKEGYRRSGYANSRMTTGKVMHRRLETKLNKSRLTTRAYVIIAAVLGIMILAYLMGAF
jgi:CRISPR/Cas system-associated exonuclease Cas4 (RecB family)